MVYGDVSQKAKMKTQLYVPQDEAALTSYELRPQKHRENLYPGL